MATSPESATSRQVAEPPGSRAGQLQKHIQDLNDLLAEYEEKLHYEDDPKAKRRFAGHIEEVRRQIEEYTRELMALWAGETTAANLRSAITLSARVFGHTIQRTDLFARFLDLARLRDILFAIGGVGCGLHTFRNQFHEYLKSKPAQCYNPVDFDLDTFRIIRSARHAYNAAIKDYTRELGADQMDLKCLLASLAYSTYGALRADFRERLDSVVPQACVEPVHFAEWYFGNSQAMKQAEPTPIVDYFFETLQSLAEATTTEGVLLFMPWLRLSECFLHASGIDDRKLGFDFWDALGEFATPREWRSSPAGMPTSPLDRYDKVCLIVMGRHVPYGRRAYRKALVAKSVWPIPPLRPAEIMQLLSKISIDFSDLTIANLVFEWTGGSPWLTRFALSYIDAAYHQTTTSIESVDPGSITVFALRVAESAFLTGDISLSEGPLRDFVAQYISEIRNVLGPGEPTDGRLEQAWAGPGLKRQFGFDINSRVESFVASGLVWLDGDVWEPSADDGLHSYVFRKYPTVYFSPAGRLSVAVYRAATGRDIRLCTY